MSLHKLTAGDGYTYLTRQVAAHDATNRGYENLGEYYSEKGEAPGVWMGRGLSGVPDFRLGEHVTEAQMVALFGEGRIPTPRRSAARCGPRGRVSWPSTGAAVLVRRTGYISRRTCFMVAAPVGFGTTTRHAGSGGGAGQDAHRAGAENVR